MNEENILSLLRLIQDIGNTLDERFMIERERAIYAQRFDWPEGGAERNTALKWAIEGGHGDTPEELLECLVYVFGNDKEPVYRDAVEKLPSFVLDAMEVRLRLNGKNSELLGMLKKESQ